MYRFDPDPQDRDAGPTVRRSAIELTVPALHGLHWHKPGKPACLAFGYAGAGGSALRCLLDAMPHGYGLAEFVPPGRGKRFLEPVEASLDDISRDALKQAKEMGRAPILFGYSLGGLLAYRTAALLEAEGLTPAGLIVCAINAPHRLPPPKNVHRYDLPRLRDHLSKLGGTPLEILEDDDALGYFAPAVRQDYRLLETYEHAAHTLRCPVLAIGGRRDELTTSDGLHAWSELATAGYDEVWLPAGHFFLHSHTRDLNEIVAGWIAARTPSRTAG